MDYVIEVKDVTYNYPLTEKPSLKNINLNIERGKFYGVIGENGSGKTTLGALIRGFAPSFYQGTLQGEVIYEGRPVSEYGGELAMKIGYVFQNPFTQISGVKETVFEEIAYGLENFGVPVDEIVERVVKVMKLTDIQHLAMKSPFDLSGGQMQRVALASVIVLEPDVLIIDEPTSQLDPEGTESVFAIIRQLKEQHKTVILVEHKIDLIAEYADEVIVMRDSEIVAMGKKEDILSDMSLLGKGAAVPQVAILANKLKERGLALSEIPVTEDRAVEVIREALKGRA